MRSRACFAEIGVSDMSQQLSGKTALVTGAASGIGRATARLLADAGASVLVADIDDEGGEATVRQISDSGGDALFLKADASVDADIAQMVEVAVKNWGQLDCAVNNAAISGRMGVAAADHPEEDFDKVIDVNLKGVWRCMKHQIRQMLSQGGGSIVNVSSAAGLVGLPNVAYTASKHGVNGLTKSAAIVYARKNVRINSVCPGYVDTAIVSSAVAGSAEDLAKLLNTVPARRLAEPEEVAETILWLCSGSSSFVTGHCLAVDGGLTAQ